MTAQQASAYKPDKRGFRLALERLALPPDRILHVAQSLFHDHVPAKELGLTTVWIDEATHTAGVAALLAALPTRVSLTDFVSFEVMRTHAISRAFAFDDDFRKAGFDVAS